MSIEGDFNVTLYDQLSQSDQMNCVGNIELFWNFTNHKGSIHVDSEDCELSVVSMLRFYEPVSISF